MSQHIRIGLFGFGCVGKGLYEVLHQTKGIKADIKKICVKDRNKKRSLDAACFTFEKNDLLNDPEINVIVELIDDADQAFDIVSSAIKNGKAVVSANKKMIAEHFEELFTLQQQYQVPFLYEASVCGSIPIIRNLEEYYDNDLLSSVEGICNGTTNYILTKTALEGKSYHEALKEAQDLGFAESNPRLDVQGFDPKYKLTILLAHTFGIFVKPDHVLNYGIHHLNEHDSNFAREKGLRIKLVAHTSKVGDKVKAYVLPRFIRTDELLYNVNNEYNAALVQAQFSDRQFFVGKGAGSYPTASAVLSDISALQFNYRYEYKKTFQKNGTLFSNDFPLRIYLRYDNRKVLDELQVTNIEQTFSSKTYNYIIGQVNLEQLLVFNPNER
ncbi:MAG: homoserine dehydrogenase, partial [Bacteroidia bacterium]|nr:homoserine dehydrogenase [Bacteroidia bacterium]